MTAGATPARGADWKLWLSAVVACVAVGLLAVRAAGYVFFERRALLTPPDGAETPATYGVPFSDTVLVSGARRLQARAVDAGPGSPVLVLAHGTAEALSDWADVQAIWHGQGAASFVFDYSGFGRSTGRPRAVSCNEDAVVAYAAARRHFGANRRYVLVGYSLGTGPWLEVLPSLAPAPDALALVAGYSSARAGLTAFLGASQASAMLLPDIWNNVRAVRDVRIPVLVVHSSADRTFPMAMAESVATAGHATLVRLSGYGHADGHRRPTDAYWAPVVTLARGRS